VRQWTVFGCVLGSLVGWTALAHSLGGGPVSFATVARGSVSRMKQPLEMVVRTREEWAGLWARHVGPSTAPPIVDFSAEMVVAIFAGERPTTGYGVEVTRVVSTDRGLQVTYRERTLPAGALVRPVITAPFHIIRLPRFEGPVHILRES
jgi:hypothetical protein